MKERCSLKSAGWIFAALVFFTAGCRSGGPAVGTTPRDHRTTESRKDRSPAFPGFLLLSDIHLNDQSAGVKMKAKGSSVEYSDTGTDLWNSTKAKLNEMLSQDRPDRPQFIVYLGDMPAHDKGINQPNDRGSDIGTVLGDLRRIATDNCVPLVYVPGNNDGLAADYASFEDGRGNLPFSRDTGHAADWPLIVPEPARCRSTPAPAKIVDSSLLSLGTYSAYPLGESTPLRTIALNTVIFSPDYIAVHGPKQDSAAADQLNWLKDQLASACGNGEAVLLSMHIPPGNDFRGKPDWTNALPEGEAKTYLQRFLDIVTAAPCVSALLYSHTHMDEIKMLFNESGTFTTLAISSPGITPLHRNNPGFKTVSYDPTKSFALMDFETTWADFYSSESSSIVFENAYTFSSSFGRETDGSMFDFVNGLYSKGQTDAIKAGVRKTFFVHHQGMFPDDDALEQIFVTYPRADGDH